MFSAGSKFTRPAQFADVVLMMFITFSPVLRLQCRSNFPALIYSDLICPFRRRSAARRSSSQPKMH